MFVRDLKIHNKFVVLFNNTLYQYMSGGTELFLRKLQTKYNTYGISVLSVVPTKNIFVSMYLDGKYIGVFLFKNVPEIINNIEKVTNSNFQGILIQQIFNYNFKLFEDVLERIDCPIIIGVHDFSLICDSFDFLKNGISFCGISKPSESKCKDCNRYPHCMVYCNNVDHLLKTIYKKVFKIVFPSEFCKNLWLESYPMFKEKSVVRQHLNYDENYSPDSNVINNCMLNIGYVGATAKIKGIDEWKKLLKICENENYVKFHYFGNDITTEDIGDKHFVDNRIDSMMMRNELRKNGIHISFLWSIIPETYSYAYYEAASAGTFCVTCSNSGNIARQIKKNNNGIVFDDICDLVELIKNGRMKKMYYEFINRKNRFSPLNIIDNNDISDFLFPKYFIKIQCKKNIVLKLKLISQIYEKHYIEKYK